MGVARSGLWAPGLSQQNTRRSICSFTSMITDRIGRPEVLLPINHKYNNMCDILGFLN